MSNTVQMRPVDGTPNGPPRDGDGQPLTVIVQDAPGYNSWPFVQGLGGALVCAYSRGREHSITETCRGVYARVSWDEGRHWQPETAVVNTAEAAESAIGKGLDDDGAMLLWVRCIGASWHHDLYRSRDGVAFERIAALRPSPMPMQITDILPLPGIGLLSLWFSGNYHNQPENSWGTLISHDNGRTWIQTVVEDGLWKQDWPTEPSCVHLGEGRLLAVARSERRDDGHRSRQFQLQSEDGGKTWRKFATNIGDVCESTPSLLLDGKGGLLYNYYYHRGAGLLKRRVALAERLWDTPSAWPDPEILCHGSADAHHAGNVNTCAWGGLHACAFYSGTPLQTNVHVAFAAPAMAARETDIQTES